MLKNILVIGGTRYFGKLLVQRLLAAGHSVTIATRGNATDPFGDRIKRIKVDRRNEPAMMKAFVNGPVWDVIYDQMCYSPMDAAISTRVFAGRVKRYIMASTIEVYRGVMGPRDAPFKESDLNVMGQVIDTTYPWHDPKLASKCYVAGKLQAEAYLYRDGSLPLVTVRIGHVLSGPDDFTGRLAHYVDMVRLHAPLRYANAAAGTSFLPAPLIAEFLAWAGMQDFTGPVNAACEGPVSAFDLYHRTALVLDAPANALPAAQPAAPGVLSPFDYPHPFAMDTSRAASLGFRFGHHDEWLDDMIRQHDLTPIFAYNAGSSSEGTVLSKARTTSSSRLRGVRGFFLVIALVLLLIIGIASAAIAIIVPDLPELKELTEYKPKIPLRVYTADKVLIGEFGTEHREFVPIHRVPDLMKKALLAIEDTRFYEHGGVDYVRALGAAKANVLKGGLRQGGSTITMQVARDFYLTKEKNWTRKFTEIALTYKIESELSKDQILELYMNQIYLGQRSYGFGAAARTYFGKPLDQLSVAETAMLAGLPQNPSRHNPVSNFKRATTRQHTVLRRMHELGYITQDQYDKALAEKLVINQSGQEFATHAEYVAEIARQAAVDLLKDEAYTKGIVVTTTIRSSDQDAAYEAVRRNVIAFDQRHGYRGPEARIELPADQEERDELIDDALEKRPGSDGLVPAVVTEASPKSVKAETAGGETVEISGDGLKFAAPALNANARAAIRIAPGAVIRIARDPKKGWVISQVPQVAAAFIAIDADTGATQAMVGGFDYNLQKYNHVTQAWRQPGSAFKPILFSAALEKAYFPATQILDEQLDMPGENEGDTWSPRNDDGVFDGSVTMRQALAKSKNVPSVRLLRAIDVPYMHEYMAKFGFDTARHPKNYTMALGTGLVTPMQMAGAYAVFANGGYRVTPYLIASIEDDKGTVLMRGQPTTPKQEDNRAIDERNAFIMDSMMHDVTRYGTGAAAMKQLDRPDIAGKTGTTNDAIDGWFAGYGGNIVGVAWMGYDEPKSLGGREFGATLALPFWIDYMKVALKDKPVRKRTPPEGVMQFNGDWIYSEYEVEGFNTTLDMDELPPLEEPGAQPPDTPKTQETPKPAEPAAAPSTTP